MTEALYKSDDEKRICKVAIVIPVYNVQNYLNTCLESILSQTYKNFFVFAVDDGSTDSSGNILDIYSVKYPRLFVIHKKNGGVSSARNVALDEIENRGDFDLINFLDADDFVSPLFIETFVKYMNKYSADYGVCAFKSVTKYKYDKEVSCELIKEIQPLNKQEIAEHFFRISVKDSKILMDSTNSLFLNNRFFRYSKIKGLRFDERLHACEDQDFMIRAMQFLTSGIKIPKVLFYYRRRYSSLSNSRDAKKTDFIVYENLYDNINKYPIEVRLGIQNEFHHHLIQELYSKLSSRSSLSQKYKLYKHAIAILNSKTEFKMNDSIERRKKWLEIGFYPSLIYSWIRKILKSFVNKSRQFRFFS